MAGTRRKLQPIDDNANSIPPIIRALRNEVKINLDGKIWHICYDFNVTCELEQLLGAEVLAEMYRKGAPGLAFSWTRASLYLCLKAAGAPYTLEETGRFIHFGSLPIIRDALLKAWTSAMADPQKTEAEETDENPTLAATAGWQPGPSPLSSLDSPTSSSAG